MPGAINNTTSLNMGGPKYSGNIGTRNFKDSTAKMISANVSRSNYKQGIKSDARLQKLREAVYKMVSTWPDEDKIFIIQSYGDWSLVKNNRSSDYLSKICTESMIIHLDPSDLEQLYNDMAIETRNMRRDIKKIRRSRPKPEAYPKLYYSKNKKEYIKNRKKTDITGVPKYITRQYSKLRKELYDVLKTCFDKIEISVIASNLGIEIDKESKIKDIHTQIINKVCVYVDILLGKGKLYLANSVSDRSTYDKLLKYTSYSYLTGEPGLSPTEWNQIKMQARRAKAAIAERLRMQKRRRVATNGSAVAAITGGNTANTLRGLAKKINANDVGILQDATYEELATLAGRYGIDPTSKSNKNVGILKAKIYNGMRLEAKRTSSLERTKKSLTNRGKTTRSIDDLLSVHNIKGNATEYISKGKGGSSTPLVSFDKDGTLLDNYILKAVPVYIVGQGGAGQTRSLKEIKERKFSQNYGSSLLTAGKIRSKGYDPSVHSAAELSQIETETYAYFMSLPYLDKTVNLRTNRRFLDIIQVFDYFKSVGILERILQSVMINCGLSKDGISVNMDKIVEGSKELNDLRRHACWIYAYLKGYRKLQSYLTNKYGIVYKIRKNLLKTENVAFWKKLPVIKGIRRVINFFTDLAINTKAKAKPTNYSDLNDKSKLIYNTIKNEEFSSLKVILGSKYSSNSAAYTVFMQYIDKLVENKKENIAKGMLSAIIALRIHNDSKVENVFLYEAGIIDRDGKKTDNESYAAYITFKRASRGFSTPFKAIARLFKNTKNLFSKRTENLAPISGVTETDDFDVLKNKNQRYPIPKFEWKPGESSDEIIGKIHEAVPVYVVNLLKKTTVDQPENQEETNIANSENELSKSIKGIGKNARLVKEYNAENGIVTPPGGNRIKFTHAPSVILNDMKAKGYTPKSVAIIGNKNGKRIGKIGKKYTLKDEDIQWALDNNYQFASGGLSLNSAIVGDSYNGKENREVVTWHPNGLSIRPEKAGPENGYSPLALNRYASGGLSLNSDEEENDIYQFSKKKRRRSIRSLRGQLRTGYGMLSASAQSKLKIKEILATPAIPVYVANDYAQPKALIRSLSVIADTIDKHLIDLKLGLSSDVVAAPMGVGAITRPYFLATGITDKITNVAATIAKDTADSISTALGFSTGGVIKASSGAKTIKAVPKFASGGLNTVITGDAAGNNIFKGGAKPELVSSNGDLSVIPLNKTGRESKQKITRMTTEERRQALATAISSHVIKYKFNLPDGAEEVSNVGEAIKVFNVKPGITDTIKVGETTTTLVELIGSIQTQLSALIAATATDSQLLAKIAVNTVPAVVSAPTNNVFTGGFSDSLNNILGGE